MNRALLVLITFAAISLPVVSAEKATWSTGKLIDLQSYETGAGAARAQNEYCLAIQLGDTVYLSRYQPYWRHSYDPAEMTVGEQVEIAVDGNNLLIRTPKGKPLKTRITRRERVGSGEHPTTCALRVQTE